jgi:hypothetical protein
MSKKLEIVIISFLVLVFPYMKIKFGETPLYFVDIFYLYLIVKFGFKTKVLKEIKIIFLYLLFTFFSFLAEYTSHFSIISVYFLIRFTLPFYIFFYFLTQIKNKADIYFLLKTIFWTSVVNSSFVILYSLSFTRSILTYIYNNEFFYPQKERFSTEFVSDISQRGVTLAGGANSSSFLCLIGLAVFFYLKSKKTSYKSFFFNNKIIEGVMFLFFSTASILSMSRAAFITLFFIVVYNLKIKSVRFGIIFFLIMSPVILSKTNVLQYVDYSRIIQSVAITAGESDLGHSEEERIDAYTKPFELLIQYPIMFVIGKGLSNHKVSKSHKYGYYEQELKGMHGLLGSIAYDRGFIAFFCFLYFIFKLYRTSFFNSSSQYKYLNKFILIIILMPLITTHIFTNQVNGVYQIAFLSALIILLERKTSSNNIKII